MVVSAEAPMERRAMKILLANMKINNASVRSFCAAAAVNPINLTSAMILVVTVSVMSACGSVCVCRRRPKI